MKDPKTIINEELTRWSITFIQNRLRDARKLKTASGQGQRSFNHQVIKAATNELARALFEFEGYLRLQDMRRLKWDKQAPLQDILKYVQQKGVNAFINGFSRKYKIPTSNVALMNQIAWGIIKKKAQTGYKHKRTRWYNKSKERDIHSLYGRLLAALRENQLESLKKNLVA